MVLSTSADADKRIAILNDAFRTTFLGGTICVTAGLHELGAEFVRNALRAVRDFNSFEDDNDPHGEHDFGVLALEERRLYWKIDYFDPTMIYHAAEPADVETTRRVLTVMLAEEY